MTRALQRELFDELTVDNFAGGGGASMAIELATRRPPAKALIEANYTAGRGVLWARCNGHSITNKEAI